MNHPDKQRKPLRLLEYDYSVPGAYFVTLCTQNRACLYGEVADETMALNASGKIVDTVWHSLPTHYPNIILDAFVVMPNHVHGILFLHPPTIMNEGVINHAPTQGQDNVGAQFIAPNNNVALGPIVRGFKARSTFLINRLLQRHNVKTWQPGYYDHIIRDDTDLARIRTYIHNNPTQWAWDTENPDSL